MLRLCSLRRENGRVSLSRVAWNGGTPFVVGGERQPRRGLGVLCLHDGVDSLSVCSLSPGFPFSMCSFHLPVFGPVFPVAWRRVESNQMKAARPERERRIPT